MLTKVVQEKKSTKIKTNKVPDFEYGTIWEDPVSGHKIGCLDASKKEDVEKLMDNKKAALAIQDPPYNVDINNEFGNLPLNKYINWSEKWIDDTINALGENSSLYIWLGADIRNGLQPLPDFIIMMRNKPVRVRNFITMRNQRGYGTQKNWMAIRQELLYYIKGEPIFNVDAEYTDIPKKTKGYYKRVNGKLTENFERSKSLTIRAGNVWHDIQQVFYLMHENIEGCFAQKPLKSAERIIEASSKPGDIVIDFFSHSGSTLLQAEMNKRIAYTMDIDPSYCKVTAARLLRFRRTGETGWGRTNVLKDGKILLSDEDLIGSPTLLDLI
ncbi:MAG: DNA methylase [Candidatus Portnoybacteria bacterium RIFCSPLOWO2_12_FULL_39_9]|uniref:DNA methylase n=1 Tax=Candidatus Portnoybacteria bacterium RIFCSPHIGHO2_12_FULL_38_9 TaxID=1801997 RepID=A0A1G2FEF0_9BACT|nr:MAG: DNA methylase [Candidatus Portnoybacteria bacterium RBG_13_40_8]OGZ35908.1 MAG: DNA methylase [Candidatus Portnoybacteria bacterium RIFCSPHIGHO2_02_FULL_39_12]OGZ36429.1 MAG: DNA methylase [Candidatus Portnoybacteria bacterium RIFCSPHIGHO2_12_FULL_38_9]OGZ39246.1 MAG: DNA methylase [Candidatus Portnoybacteria bacterium RIFCSPLOWO2_01_FULL_38_39]OGZ40242.1 MAG: DNA methylase [Candidatus Portnoybacteria bacterium RIFCSPLOWO2_12_FULL_39_9]